MPIFHYVQLFSRIAWYRCGLLLRTSHSPWSLCVWHIGEPGKTVESIDMPFRGQTGVGPDSSPRWRHLANTMHRSVRRRKCSLSLLLCLLQQLVKIFVTILGRSTKTMEPVDPKMLTRRGIKRASYAYSVTLCVWPTRL